MQVFSGVWVARMVEELSFIKLLDEFAAIQMVDVVMPTKAGPVIRKRCVSVPEPHLVVLLHKLGLKLPTSIELAKV